MNNITFAGEHARTFDVRWHSLDSWKLVYCTAGEGSFEFENGSSIHYREGDTVSPKGCAEGWFAMTGIMGQAAYQASPFRGGAQSADWAEGYKGMQNAQ